MDSAVLVVVTAQLVLFTAIGFCLWQARRRDRWLWLLVALCISLAATRWFVTLHRLLSGELAGLRNLPAELVGLATTVAVLWFVVWLAKLLDSMRRHEKALRESEQLFRKMFEGSPIGIALVDLTGKPAMCNPALDRMLGYSERELCGMRFPDFTHPDDVEADWNLFRELAAGERDRYAVQKRYVRKDGVIIWGDLAVSALGDSAGAPKLAIGIVQDVTERKLAEAALRESERHFREFVERAPYGMYQATADGRFLMVNPALVEMLRYDSAEQLMAVDIERDVFCDAATRAGLVERCNEAGIVEGAEVEWKRRDGTRLTVRLSGRPIPDEADGVKRYELIAEDVTTERTLAAQLRQAQKMEAVGQLTGGIAHDFNNILTVIIANAALVADRLGRADATVLADLAELRSAAERGAAMVKKLLGFSRRDRLALKPQDPAHVVADAATMLARLLPERIAVRTTVEAPVAAVLMDTGAVEQMIMNLATNARDAMPDGGALTLEVRQSYLDEGYHASHPWVSPGDYVCVSVRDTGVGMDDDTKAHVFEPFFTTKEHDKGTGLGMAMVYGLMKQHSGFVHVYSEPGEGTDVKLYFPVSGSEKTAPKQGAGVQTSLPMGTETILLVEDEPSIRRASERILEAHGYKLLVAGDGEEAIEMFEAHEGEIGLVITDLVMPKLGGRQLYDALRGRGKKVRFLFTSGYSGDDVRRHIGPEPGTAFLQKPWILGDLLGQVRELLDVKVKR